MEPVGDEALYHKATAKCSQSEKKGWLDADTGTPYTAPTTSDGKDTHNHHRELSDSWIRFVNQCRKHIGSKELSEGIIELLGADNLEIKERLSPDIRLRRMLGIHDSLPSPLHVILRDSQGDRKEHK